MLKHKNFFNFCLFMLVVIAVLMTTVFWAKSAVAATLNPNVTQDNIHQTICIPGWTKTIRPPTRYTNKIKSDLLGTTDKAILGQYELDHDKPLSSGGAPRDKDNLKLQLWTGTCNARQKDRLERAANKAICSGKITLRQGQRLFDDWAKSYKTYYGKAC